MLDIRCDLQADLEEFAKKSLDRVGYRYSHDKPVLLQYLNVIKREIQPSPRSVQIAPNLNCPQEYKQGFRRLIRQLKKGANVNYYLSSNIKNANFNDGFLNDFGLHHFHLGTKIEFKGKSAGFIERTGPVLLAYITDTHVYLLGIKTHGKSGDPYIWTDDDVIELLHDNWPHVLEKFKINGITSLRHKVSKEDRKILRKKCANSFIEMKDGTVYASPGGGITCANTSTDVQHQYFIFLRISEKLLGHICQKISSNHQYVRSNQHIRLKVISANGYIACHDKLNEETHIAQLIAGNKIKYIHYCWGRWPDYYPPTKHFNINPITMQMKWK